MIFIERIGSKSRPENACRQRRREEFRLRSEYASITIFQVRSVLSLSCACK